MLRHADSGGAAHPPTSEGSGLSRALKVIEQLLGVDGGLADRIDTVEKIVELSGQFVRRLHGHDLVCDELKGILDQVELRASHAEVAADLVNPLHALLDDG